MINGAHVLFYSRNPEQDRAFLRDVVGLKAIDIGRGWMLFRMPPTEAAVHPVDEADETDRDHTMMTAHVYLMCDDVEQTIADLGRKGVTCAKPNRQSWGIVTQIPLPSGGHVGLYQPLHPTAIQELS